MLPDGRPASPANTTVVLLISGANFGTGEGLVVVIGAFPCSIDLQHTSHTAITCSTSMCSGLLNVTVAGVQWVTSSYSYVGLVQVAAITAVAPLHGPTSGGTLVRLTGTNFRGDGAVVFQRRDAASRALIGGPLPCTVVAYNDTFVRSDRGNSSRPVARRRYACYVDGERVPYYAAHVCCVL